MTQENQTDNAREVFEPRQIPHIADWEMARALYADTFSYPINVADEWIKLVNGPEWNKAEGFKRMARKCREALELRGLNILPHPSPSVEHGDVVMRVAKTLSEMSLIPGYGHTTCRLLGGLSEALSAIPIPSIKSSVTNTDLTHHSALHAYLGYTDSFKAGDVVTQAYIDRLHGHYLPNLTAALEHVKPSIPECVHQLYELTDKPNSPEIPDSSKAVVPMVSEGQLKTALDFARATIIAWDNKEKDVPIYAAYHMATALVSAGVIAKTGG